MTQVVVTDRLGEHATAWDALVDRSPLPSPFLYSWWLAHVAVGEPVFVLVHDDGRLIGGAAFQRSHRAGVEWIELLGDGPIEPDHLDLVADPARVGTVTTQIREWLSRPGDRVADLAGLADGAWLLDALPRRTEVQVLQVAPYAPLPANWDDYLAARPGQVRSTITRTTKRLAKAGVLPRRRDPADIEASLEDLRRLHDSRWGDHSGFLGGWEGFAAALRAGAPTGAVRFSDLVDRDGRVIAVELELRAGRREAFYQAGRLEERDLRGSGSVLKAAVIQAAIAEGMGEFDLLRGDEPYKAEWATERRSLLRARAGFGPRGVAIAGAAVANHRVQQARRARRQRQAAESTG